MASSNLENRPRTRQRKFKPAPALEVPDIEVDAAERKRVLNILAQRRYRQRKRQLRQGPTAAAGPGDEGTSGTHGGNFQESALECLSDNDSHPDEPTGLAGNDHPVAISQDLDLSIMGHQPSYPNLEIAGLSPFSKAIEAMPVDISNFVVGPMYSESMGNTDFNIITTFNSSDFVHDANLSAITATTPSLIESLDFQPESSTRVSSSTTTTTTTTPPDSFPDGYLLPMSELTLLRALLRIAARLNAHAVWDITANSPFNNTNIDLSWTSSLPAAWQPTNLQINTAHHPLIDLLPWPSVRDRMISMLSLPARAPNTTGSTTSMSDILDAEETPMPKPEVISQSEESGIPPLLGFIYDMEDGAEGIRIWGGDPYDGNSWEIGQVVFQRWWFVFDRRVVERSNYWRRLRGAEALRMGG